MFKSIQFLLKKFLGVFTVTNDKYTVERIEATSGYEGVVYCLTEKATGQQCNLLYSIQKPRISPAEMDVCYVNYSIDNEHRMRGRPTVTYEYLKNPSGELVPVRQEHREVLFSYFAEDRRLKQQKTAKRPDDPTPTGGTLSELNS